MVVYINVSRVGILTHGPARIILLSKFNYETTMLYTRGQELTAIEQYNVTVCLPTHSKVSVTRLSSLQYYKTGYTEIERAFEREESPDTSDRFSREN